MRESTNAQQSGMLVITFQNQGPFDCSCHSWLPEDTASKSLPCIAGQLSEWEGGEGGQNIVSATALAMSDAGDSRLHILILETACLIGHCPPPKGLGNSSISDSLGLVDSKVATAWFNLGHGPRLTSNKCRSDSVATATMYGTPILLSALAASPR